MEYHTLKGTQVHDLKYTGHTYSDGKQTHHLELFPAIYNLFLLLTTSWYLSARETTGLHSIVVDWLTLLIILFG